MRGVKKTKGKTNVAFIRWLLYGPPKIGKTSLLSGFPNAVFAATEKGYKALRVSKRDILSWEDFLEFVEDMVEGDHEFKTAIIDTVDQLVELCAEYTNAKLGIQDQSEGEWGRGWREVKKEFTLAVNQLMMSKYGIVFVSHTKSDKITTMMNEITKTVPTLSNQARRILLPMVDTIGLMRYKKKKLDKDNYEERLIITFKGTETLEAGDRMGVLPPEVVLKAIPEGKKRTPEVVEKYARMNYEKIRSYYEGGEKK